MKSRRFQIVSIAISAVAALGLGLWFRETGWLIASFFMGLWAVRSMLDVESGSPLEPDAMLPTVNPATGLSMVRGTLMDASGSPFGSDLISTSDTDHP